MKVKIITDSMNGKLTGVGNYTRNVVENVERSNIIIEKINYKKITEDTKIYKNILEGKILETYGWYLTLPLRIKKEENVIIHNTSGAPTFFRFKNKSIFTVHDLTPITHGNKHKLGKKWIFQLFLPRTLKYADRIVAMSENTKKDILKCYPKIDKTKIKVVYPYASEDFRIIKDKKALLNCRKKYNLPEKFFLYVGTLEPRKNIDNILKAIAEIYNKVKIPLVIVGTKGWKYNSIFKKYRDLNLDKRVFFTGYVNQQDLPTIYNLAICLIYPSFYEGFGLPPLEAMKCGTPVITSNTSSLPEVVGNSEIMIDPNSVEELEQKMYKVATDKKLREKLRSQGLERSKKFNKEDFARKIISIYEELVPENK